jgi:hypothetical protein
MSRVCSIPLCTVLVALIFPVGSPAAGEPAWLEIHSAHYTVITDAGEKRGREVALRFEQMRAVFANLLSKDRLNQSIPLTIFALDNDKSYYQAAPLDQGQPIGLPGFLLPGEDQDFIVLNLSEGEPWRAVAHDFALMLLTFNYPPTQRWFDQGLANYFSSIRVDNRQVEIGGDPDPNLSGYRSNGRREQAFTKVLATQDWIPLPELFAMSSDASTGTKDSLVRAQSWIVMHYLLHEKKLPETGAYFDFALNQRLTVADAIQKAYGASPTEFEQAIKDYFRSQFGSTGSASTPAAADSSSAAIARFPAPVGAEDSAITSKPIPEPEVRAMYAGIQIRIPERREYGLKTLQDLATKPTPADQKAEAKQSKRMGEDPDQLPSNSVGNPVAHRILAWDHIEHGEFDEAFAELGDAAALNPRDMWIRYYLSLAKYRRAQAQHNQMLGLANMMLDLRSVLEWYPEMADAYDLLAVARNAGGGPSAALQAERSAISLSPRNEYYRLHLAQIYVASKKWDSANALVDRLKASDDPRIVAQANELLSQAGAERKYGIPLDAKGNPQTKFAPQKSPFDVLEQDQAKRDAAESATEAAGDKSSMKFVKGRLVAVDCSKPPAAELTVKSDSGTLKLHAPDFKSIQLIGADDFSCDWRDRRVTVNYKPRGAVNGDLVSLEVR